MMKLFAEQDLIPVNGMLITRDIEKLLNAVANKAAPLNLTSVKLGGTKVPYIQGELKNYLRSTINPNMGDWESFLDNSFLRILGIDLNEASIELGKILLSWLEYPSSLPDPTQIEDKWRVGADADDKNIISNSFKYYNIEIGHCANWIKKLLLERNYMGGLAQFFMRIELQKYIEGLMHTCSVRLSFAAEDRDGIDLVAEINGVKSKLYQVKNISYKSSHSIKKAYSRSYAQEINFLYYDINVNREYYLSEIVNNDNQPPIIKYP